MTNQIDPKLSKWPFFLGDAVAIGLAYFIYAQSKLPMGHWEIACFLASGALGAVLSVVPFLLEYRAMIRLSEADMMTSVATQIKDLEMLAVQISAATTQWQVVQEHSGKSVGAAKDIAERMSAEAESFRDFLHKANDREKTNLRLEVEKLRRAEGDWLQIVVHMLDHTYALHQAAVRSGQPGLMEQLGHFQNTCRDVARRTGLVAFAPATNDPFDAQFHQTPETQEQPPADAKVGQVLAPGYNFQGRLLRPALVALDSELKAAVAQEQPVAPKADDKTAPALAEEQTLL